ncbi:MAG TPA: hypothetical protein VHZ55_00515 [Bryobacteraceae bacterium]|jgi:WD40 repeat protein|nr:hypothetical protein [Bryobacteraceae bacterium]
MPGVMQSSAPALRTVQDRKLDDFVVALRWLSSKQLVAGVAGGAVTLMSKDLEVLAQFCSHNGLNCLCSNASGDRLATGGQDGKARIWDAATLRCIEEISVGVQWVECVAYSPTRGYLLVAGGRKLLLHSASDRTLIAYPEQPSTVSDVQWQPDSLFFTVAAYGKLSTFSASSTKAVKEFAWKGSILKVAWSPDANYVVTGNQDATVHFWYRKTGRDLEMSGYPAKIRELSWDSGSTLLATGGSPVVTVWKCDGKGPSGTRPIELKGHHGFVSALAFQRRGRLLVSGGRDGRVCLWEPKRSERMLSGIELASPVTQIEWDPTDLFFAVGTEDGTVALFEP